MSSNDSKGKKLIKDATSILPESIRDAIYKKIVTIIDYEPVIGIMGKTGAGKSSLCNAIFKGEVCEVSDVGSCTRDVQELQIKFGNRSIKIIDIPGVGENSSRDKEYEELYKELVPKLDLILWVIKGDDRAFSADEHFYKNILQPIGGADKTLFVLNQVDKIEPFREWDINKKHPSVNQLINIRKKEEYVTERFGFTKYPIISVSADEGYNTNKLVEEMVRALPKQAQSGIVAQVKDEHKTKEVIEEAQNGFAETISETIDDIIEIVLPKPAATLAKAAKKVVVSTVKKLWGFFFG